MKIHQKLAQGNLNFSKNWVQWIERISTSMQTIDLIASIPNIKNAVRQSKRQVFLRKKKEEPGWVGSAGETTPALIRQFEG